MKIKRIKELIALLNKASKAYYMDNEEIMSNFEYDKYYDELVKLEEETGIIYPDSPTQKIGFEVISNLKKVKHETRMLSLDKTKDIDKLKSFLTDKSGTLSWKLDGLTIVLNYKDGKLQRAITRGNGDIGEDITHNVKVFKNIPIHINYKNDLTIRGEAIISYSEFNRINSLIPDASEKYKNPRNLCSGTVRQLNSQIVAERNVFFFAFSIVNSDINISDLKSDQMIWLESQGFDIVEFEIVSENNIEEKVKAFQSKIKDNDFGSDGLVLTFDSISYSNSLGVTSKFPKDSIAFKWADEVMETKLINIEWNTSRTGLINPVAIFEPIELEGTTVERASLHNVSILKSLQLGINDIIKVYKANMIIPQVLDNITRSDTIEIPKNCSVCNSVTELIKQKDVEMLYCSNPNCKAQVIRSLSHFTSRDAMNIEGLSELTIEKFIEKGFISNYLDIYSLNKFEDEIKNMEGFGEKSFNKLMISIENSKIVELPNFIYALGINQVGLSNARLLCVNFGYDVEKITSATFDELNSIEGYGEIISKCILDYFNNEKNKELFYKALEILKIEKPEIVEEDQLSLNGKTFVITGNLEKFANRNELKATIEKLGGKVTGSVSKNTDYLINNDVNSNSSKNKKANELNIPIISEDEFIKLI